VTIKGFYLYYMHASRSAAIFRRMLLTILMFASRRSSISLRNLAIVPAAETAISVLMSKSTIVQAYAIAIYTHTKM